MKYILANAYREYRIRLTNPILPMWDVLVPVIYLLVFGAALDRWVGRPFAGANYSSFFFAGVVGMVTFSVALNSSYAFFEDLQSGMFHELLTYPFPRRDLLLGKLLFNAAFGLVGAALCTVAAAAVLEIDIDLEAVAGIALWTAIGTAAWYLLCAWISLTVRGFNSYHTVTSALYLLLMFVSNLFYPVEGLPSALRYLAWANPLTWQVDLLRHHVLGGGDPAVLAAEAGGFLAFLVVVFWLANRRLNGPME